jgi:O-antigen ligase
MLWTLVFYVALGAIGGIAVPGSTWSLPSPEEETVRLKGFSGQPNVFASHIGVFIILTLIARKKGLIGRVAGVGMLVLGLSTLIATGSRTTLIAVLIAWGLVAIRPIFIAIAGIVSLFLVLAVSNSLPDLTGVIGKFSRSGSDSEILTLTGRTDIWEVVWTKVMQKPFFGWGFNGTEALLLNSFDKSFYGTAVNAHNMYLQALISLGFIGALPAFGLVFLLIWRCMQSSDQVRDLPIAYVLFHGTAEAQIFMTPDILLIVSSWVIAREAVKRLGSACPSM